MDGISVLTVNKTLTTLNPDIIRLFHIHLLIDKNKIRRFPQVENAL